MNGTPSGTTSSSNPASRQAPASSGGTVSSPSPSPKPKAASP